MSDIKSPVSRVHAGQSARAGMPSDRPAFDRTTFDPPARVERDTDLRPRRQSTEVALLSEFISPPRETAEWLGNPAMTAALAAVSADLAPDGVAGSKRDQYAASVVETHLAARRQLARHLNALLRA